MVPRAELAAAAAEVRASRDEAQARAGDLASAEDRLERAQELLKAARAESSRLQAALAGSVPRAELVAAKARVEEADARTEAAREELLAKAKEWEAEESRLRSTMQVLWWLSGLLAVVCFYKHAFAAWIVMFLGTESCWRSALCCLPSYALTSSSLCCLPSHARSTVQVARSPRAAQRGRGRCLAAAAALHSRARASLWSSVALLASRIER
jgi:hypothetical protein